MSDATNIPAPSMLEEYQAYANYVTTAYAKLRERRENGIRDTDVLESPMYKRHYGSTTDMKHAPNAENKVDK